MRYFKMVCSDRYDSIYEEILSEKDILDYYWPYWSKEAEKRGAVVSKESCIEDWVMVHWAEEVDEA